MKKYILWACLFVSPLLASDQVVDLEVARKQIQAQTIEIVATAMNLADADAEPFWAIYKQYEAERTKLGDTRVVLLNEFMGMAEDMTEDQAKAAVEKHFAMQKDRIALSEKYYQIMEERVSARVAARFVQVMSQIDTVVDSSLASEMPLIGGF